MYSGREEQNPLFRCIETKMNHRFEKAKYLLGRFLRVMGDMMLLNALWVICSLPVFTVGPATCALFSVMLKAARDEDCGTIRSFFAGFKNNFRQGFILGLIVLAGIVIIYVDARFALTFEGSMKTLYLLLSGVLAAILLVFISYTFALTARFENTLRGCIKNAFLLAFLCPGKTVLMWVILAFPAALFLLLPGNTVLSLGIFFILFAVAAPAFFNSKILRDIFDKIADSSSAKPEDSLN